MLQEIMALAIVALAVFFLVQRQLKKWTKMAPSSKQGCATGGCGGCYFTQKCGKGFPKK